MKYKNKIIYTESKKIPKRLKDRFYRICSREAWFYLKTDIVRDKEYIYFYLNSGYIEVMRKEPIINLKGDFLTKISSLLMKDIYIKTFEEVD